MPGIVLGAGDGGVHRTCFLAFGVWWEKPYIEQRILELDWVGMDLSSPTHYLVTLGKLFSLSGPQFPPSIVWGEIIIITTSLGLLLSSNKQKVRTF